MKKHYDTKHREFKTCPVCKNKFDNEITLTDHMKSDHSDCSDNLSESLTREDNFNIQLEQVQKEADLENGDLSDVSLDEENMEQLDRDMRANDGF